MSNSLLFKGETLSHILRALITPPGDPGETTFKFKEEPPQATKPKGSSENIEPKEPKKVDETDAEPQNPEKPAGSCKI